MEWKDSIMTLLNPGFPVHDEKSCEKVISESQGSEKTDSTQKTQTASLTHRENISHVRH